MKHNRLEHQFVQFIPRDLEPGVLYISMEYATAAHSCCCGCGEEVVTPFTPTDWRIIFDGETVSLWPSIGNWNLPCNSHYIIRQSRVIEAEPWSDTQIAAERQRDKAAKATYYGTPKKYTPSQSPSTATQQKPRRLWQKLRRLFCKLW